MAIYKSKGRELHQDENDSSGPWTVELGAGNFFSEYDG